MRRKLVVLGGGTAGTMVVNKLYKKLDKRDWSITVIDRDNKHLYQPGLLLLPFGVYTAEELVKDKDRFFPKGVEYRRTGVDHVDPENSQIFLDDGQVVEYDQLVIATGTTPRPDQTPGMDDPAVWRKSIFDFYTCLLYTSDAADE